MEQHGTGTDDGGPAAALRLSGLRPAVLGATPGLMMWLSVARPVPEKDAHLRAARSTPATTRAPRAPSPATAG